MGNIRCTSKLLNEIRAEPAVTPKQLPNLSDWHANLLRVDRKKCVLFTNDLTLYSFLIHMVKESLSVGFGEQFRLGLLKSLMSDKLDELQVKRMLSSQGTVMIAQTNNRSVLGSMNDLVFQIRCLVYSMGGLADANLSVINHHLNRIPMSAIRYSVGIEELKRRLLELD